MAIQPEPVTQSQDSSPATPTVSPQNFKKWLFIALPVILILCSSIFYLKSHEQKIIISSVTPTISQTPSPTPEQTTNWKTYTNSAFQFTLRYPERLFVKEFGQSLILITSEEVEEMGPDGYSADMEISITEGNTIDEDFETIKDGFITSTEKYITLDGAPGRQIRGDGKDMLFERYVIFTQVYKIDNTLHFSYVNSSSAKFTPALYDQILSTVIFRK